MSEPNADNPAGLFEGYPALPDTYDELLQGQEARDALRAVLEPLERLQPADLARRAELADLGADWDRFAEELGTERRQIRYGPLIVSAPNTTVSSFQANPFAVPKEVRALYAAELEARRQAEARARFESAEGQQVGTEALNDSQDAATYDPAAPSVTLPQPSIFFEEPGGDQ